MTNNFESIDRTCDQCEVLHYGGYACTRKKGCLIIERQAPTPVEHRAMPPKQRISATCKSILAVMRAHEVGGNTGDDIDLKLAWREYEQAIRIRTELMISKMMQS